MLSEAIYRRQRPATRYFWVSGRSVLNVAMTQAEKEQDNGKEKEKEREKEKEKEQQRGVKRPIAPPTIPEPLQEVSWFYGCLMPV